MLLLQKKLSESFDDIGRGIDEDALRYAQEATFTEDLGKNIFANIQKMTVEYPAMQLLLPFVRTPTNLLKRAGDKEHQFLRCFQKQLEKTLRLAV